MRLLSVTDVAFDEPPERYADFPWISVIPLGIPPWSVFKQLLLSQEPVGLTDEEIRAFGMAYIAAINQLVGVNPDCWDGKQYIATGGSD